MKKCLILMHLRNSNIKVLPSFSDLKRHSIFLNTLTLTQKSVEHIARTAKVLPDITAFLTIFIFKLSFRGTKTPQKSEYII